MLYFFFGTLPVFKHGPLQVQQQPAHNHHSTRARRFCTGHLAGLQCWTCTFEYYRLYPVDMTDKAHLFDLHDDNDDFKETKWPRGVILKKHAWRPTGVDHDIGGDGSQSGAMWLGDPDTAERVFRENQDSLKSKVKRTLGGAALAWSDSRAPCLTSLRVLRGYLQNLDHISKESVLQPPPPQTALEGHHGTRLVLESVEDCTMSELTAFFAEQVLPARLKPQSWKEYDRA